MFWGDPKHHSEQVLTEEEKLRNKRWYEERGIPYPYRPCKYCGYYPSDWEGLSRHEYFGHVLPRENALDAMRKGKSLFGWFR